jgi:hypothetical protein
MNKTDVRKEQWFNYECMYGGKKKKIASAYYTMGTRVYPRGKAAAAWH